MKRYFLLNFSPVEYISSVAHRFFLNSDYLIKKLLVSDEELFNEVEQVSVEHTTSARFPRYGRKIIILECSWF